MVYNGVDLDKVIFNGVEVFSKAPTIIREPAEGEYYTFNGLLTPGDDYYWLFGNCVTNGVINFSFGTGTKQTTPKINGVNGITSYNVGEYTYYRGSLRKIVGGDSCLS